LSCLTPSQKKEVDRIARVCSQMVTAHATLRDMYRRRALLLDTFLLACSIAVCTLALADLHVIEDMLKLSADQARGHLAIFSSVLFLAILVQANVDWKGKADEHARACQSYGRVSLMTRGLDAKAGPAQQASLADLRAHYELVGQTSIPVPDGRFLGLKAVHLRKVSLSQCLDRYPNMSVRLVALVGKLRDTRAALRRSLTAPRVPGQGDGDQPEDDGGRCPR